MTCDHCDKPAVVHEVIIKDGQKQEVHLCEEHAAEAGHKIPVQAPINEMLTQFVSANVPGGSKKRRQGAKCGSCGLTFARVRKTGILGCPECYKSFDKQLGTLVSNAHGGGTHHVGKQPTGREGLQERKAIRQKLVRELDDAVASEQYERAARLRDSLMKLDTEDVHDKPELEG